MRVRLIQNRAILGQLRAQLGTAEYRRYRLLTGQGAGALGLRRSARRRRHRHRRPGRARIHERNPRLRRPPARRRPQGRVGVAAAASSRPWTSAAASASTTPPSGAGLDTDRSGQVRVSFDIPWAARTSAAHRGRRRHQAAPGRRDDLMLKVSGHHRPPAPVQRSPPDRPAARTAGGRRPARVGGLRAALRGRPARPQRPLHHPGRPLQRPARLIENRAQQTTLQAQLLGLAGELRSALRTPTARPDRPELLGTAYVPPPCRRAGAHRRGGPGAAGGFV